MKRFLVAAAVLALGFPATALAVSRDQADYTLTEVATDYRSRAVHVYGFSSPSVYHAEDYLWETAPGQWESLIRMDGYSSATGFVMWRKVCAVLVDGTPGCTPWQDLEGTVRADW
jgi:hypothetical protein